MTIKDLAEACRDNGLALRTWTGSQREPGYGLAIHSPDRFETLYRAVSQDSLGTALMYAERDLKMLTAVARDVGFCS